MSQEQNRGRRHAQSEQKANCFLVCLLEPRLRMNTDQEPPPQPSQPDGGRDTGSQSPFFPIIDNIIKKNKLYNNTFSLICWGIISIVLLLKKRKKRGNHTIYVYGCVYTYMLRKESCSVQTVGVCLGNEERMWRRGTGSREERELQPPGHGAGRRPTMLFSAPLGDPFPWGRGERPTEWTHKKPKEPTKDHFSLISKFLPPRRKQQP